MIHMEIPGREPLTLAHAVLDYNGTIAVDGLVLEELKPRLLRLRELVEVHVLTADTYGTVEAQCRPLGLAVHTFPRAGAAACKAGIVRDLSDGAACFGNGFNDIPMFDLAALAVAVLEGAYAGTGFGLAEGLLWELAYAGGFGGLVFGMALAGMAVGAASQYVLSQNFFSCLLCSAVVLGALDGLRLIRALFIRLDTLDVLLRVAVPEVLLSLCWTPLVYLIFRVIFRRVGGTRLA